MRISTCPMGLLVQPRHALNATGKEHSMQFALIAAFIIGGLVWMIWPEREAPNGR